MLNGIIVRSLPELKIRSEVAGKDPTIMCGRPNTVPIRVLAGQTDEKTPNSLTGGVPSVGSNVEQDHLTIVSNKVVTPKLGCAT